MTDRALRVLATSIVVALVVAIYWLMEKRSVPPAPPAGPPLYDSAEPATSAK